MSADRPEKVKGLIESAVFFKEKVILSWDWPVAAVAAGLVAWFVPDDQLRSAVGGLSGAGLAVSTALVGVVIAALAVVVAFLDDRFIELIDRATREKYGGMEGQLFPFWFTSGLGIATVLLSVGCIAFAGQASKEWERALAAALTFLLVWTALAVLNLVGYIHYIGVARAELVRNEIEERERTREENG